MLRQQVLISGGIGFMILNDVIRAEIMKAIDASGSPSAKKALNGTLGSPPVTISTEQVFGSSE